jgi:hypothetical protein
LGKKLRIPCGISRVDSKSIPKSLFLRKVDKGLIPPPFALAIWHISLTTLAEKGKIAGLAHRARTLSQNSSFRDKAWSPGGSQTEEEYPYLNPF